MLIAAQAPTHINFEDVCAAQKRLKIKSLEFKHLGSAWLSIIRSKWIYDFLLIDEQEEVELVPFLLDLIPVKTEII